MAGQTLEAVHELVDLERFSKQEVFKPTLAVAERHVHLLTVHKEDAGWAVIHIVVASTATIVGIRGVRVRVVGSPRRVEQCVLFETLLVAELVAQARDARHEAATLECKLINLWIPLFSITDYYRISFGWSKVLFCGKKEILRMRLSIFLKSSFH